MGPGPKVLQVAVQGLARRGQTLKLQLQRR